MQLESASILLNALAITLFTDILVYDKCTIKLATGQYSFQTNNQQNPYIIQTHPKRQKQSNTNPPKMQLRLFFFELTQVK
jgi:hypothetical protein